MVIIRKKRFPDAGEQAPSAIDLIDSPDKLLEYARREDIVTSPLDVEATATGLGIAVKYSPLDDDLSGVLRLNPENDEWEMTVNSGHHPNRQRYTIAHELGHFCLHRYEKKEFEDHIFFRAESSDKMEWDANEFAARILMPEGEFRDLVREGVSSVDELARKFAVSSLALRIRAKQLGFSGHGL